MKKICVCAIVSMLLLSAWRLPAFATPKTIGVTLLTREHQFYRDLEAAQVSEAQNAAKVTVTAGEFGAGDSCPDRRLHLEKGRCSGCSPMRPLAVGILSLPTRPGYQCSQWISPTCRPRARWLRTVPPTTPKAAGRRNVAKALNGRGKVVIINHPGSRRFSTGLPGSRK